MNTIDTKRTIEAAARGTDGLTLYGEVVGSRLLLGTAQYPSPDILGTAVKRSGSEIVTVSLRREAAPVSYTHLTLPTTLCMCRSRWSPDH